MATAARFRTVVAIRDLPMKSAPQPQEPADARELMLPKPGFPQFAVRLNDPGPATPPEKRKWGAKDIDRTTRGLFSYLRSRVLPGDFHRIAEYLFAEYKCSLDCWYCWSYNNNVKGMTEDIARRSIDWLQDNSCQVLALMGGESLLRPEFVHNLAYCYNDARVMKWLWFNVIKDGFQGGVRSFED